MDFVIALLQEVGPRGDERPRFAPAFFDLATALSEIRETRNVKNPRLMLQEAYLLREWVTNESRNNIRPPHTVELLDKAQSILEEALEMLDDTRRHRRLRTIIATELASTFGTATIDCIHDSSATGREITQKFQRLLEAVRTARRQDFSSYNPVDILAWSTSALVRSNMVDENVRTEAIVDLLDALEAVDTDLLDSHNVERLGIRKLDVFTLLGNDELSETEFQNLISINSAAGFYMRALDISGARTDRLDAKEPNRKRMAEAWKYLEENRSYVVHDPRCLHLMFDCWWLGKTGQRLFETERMAPPFNENDWSYVLKLIQEIRRLGSHRDLTFSLLEAVALFHMHSVAQAMQLFREVESRSDALRGRRRIQRFFLATESPSVPKLFHGNVRWVDQYGRRGEVFVDELRRAVPFFPTDFARPEIRPRDSLGEFHIAFNFIGPSAQPQTR